MAHDVELVEQDCHLRRGSQGGVAERLPHVHDGEPDLAAFLRPQFSIESRHARLRAIVAAEPDRPSCDQVADNDAVGMALAHRDLVDADHGRRWRPRRRQLRPHVLLLQRLDRMPVEVQLPADIAH
jgi:hypothetical protein